MYEQLTSFTCQVDRSTASAAERPKFRSPIANSHRALYNKASASYCRSARLARMRSAIPATIVALDRRSYAVFSWPIFTVSSLLQTPGSIPSRISTTLHAIEKYWLLCKSLALITNDFWLGCFSQTLFHFCELDWNVCSRV